MNDIYTLHWMYTWPEGRDFKSPEMAIAAAEFFAKENPHLDIHVTHTETIWSKNDQIHNVS